MLISELIQKLEAIKAEHGDLPVYVNDNEFGEEEAKDVAVREYNWIDPSEKIKHVLVD